MITANKIPFGLWCKAIVDWMKENLEWFFDIVTFVIKGIVDGTSGSLLAMPSLVFIVGIAALAFALQRSWKLVIFTILGLLLVLNFGLWKETIETLVLVLYSTFASLLIGVPIGILASRRPWVYQAMSPVLDLMQTLPTLVYLVPVLFFFGLGFVPGLVATVIFVVPAPIRLTYLGISQVQKPLIEAGESFGCTRWQLLVKVKLPAAMPTIMAGVNQTIMLSLSMVVIAAMVGANGLGKPVLRALAQANVPLGAESGLAIVILAIILDRMLKYRQRVDHSKR
ncbi:choline ABC transporter permease subunit [Dongia sp.]|uniref:choline ABC transporter permease subunit n=1 Tax=Dongia sp. TaxID=1977262 RepID=UPI0035AE3715